MFNRPNSTQSTQPIQQKKAVFSPFAGIDEAKVMEARSGYFLTRQIQTPNGPAHLDGHYALQILSCKLVDGEKGMFFIAEGKVIQSDVDERPPGVTAAWTQRMNGTTPGAKGVAFGNILEFIAAVLQVKGAGKISDLVTAAWAQAVGQSATVQEIAEALVSGDNPFRGAMVSLTTSNITTKAGKDFTVHKWSPCTLEAPPLGDDEAHDYKEQE